MGTWLFLRITAPLRELKQASQKVAAGDLAARVPVASQDELGAVAQAFNQMAARLDEQQHLRKQMVADIAHELRTPISVMQGSLEGMIDGVLQPEPSELRELHGEARRLARLVEDLRTLSLADAGAAVYGVILGKHHLFKKTWEGSLVFFLVTFFIIIGSTDLAVEAILLISGLLTTIEVLPLPVNDNYSVAISCAFILSIIL